MNIVRLVTGALIAVSLYAAQGCGSRSPMVLGLAPATGARVTPIARVTASQQPTTISGTMIEKCPVAGCWFVVKDRTGVIRVDTKAAGFVVTDVPLSSSVVVTGAVTGGGRELAATGLRCP